MYLLWDIEDETNLEDGYKKTSMEIVVKELIDIATGQENSVSKACEYLSKVGLCAKEYINNYADVEQKELDDKIIMSIYRGERW